MVNTKNVSAYKQEPPVEFKVDRQYIANGPLYTLKSLSDVLSKGEDVIKLSTKTCISEVQYRLNMDMSGVLGLLRYIAEGKASYLKSEWCLLNAKGHCAACDSYKITRLEWIPTAHADMPCDYYVKFALHKSGNLVLVISCHP